MVDYMGIRVVKIKHANSLRKGTSVFVVKCPERA
jgi:hypothetical protein